MAEQQGQGQDRAQQLAQAYRHVATVNHYMVQVAPGYTGDELDAAEQILISEQNALQAENDEPEHAMLDLALDLLAQARKDQRRLTFRHGTAGRHAYEHTAHCIYTRVRTCLELHPGDSDMWCAPCGTTAQQTGQQVRP